MKSETGKLPKGQSYPIKPSLLAAALADAGISIDTHLVRSPGTTFDAEFWPPNPNVPYERLYIRIGSVAKERATQARQRMQDELIPHLTRWVAEILSADPKSFIRQREQWINLSP
jgi:hypothetical protein